jgi:alanine racemase
MSTGPIEWELDLDALGHNLRCVTDRLPASVRVIASVKANAYGHGVLAIGRALDELGVHGLATASPADALALRDAGVRCELLLFGGQPPGELPDLARRGITVTITNSESCAALADAQPGLPAYFKVDCGLGRLGVSIDEAEAFVHERLLPSGISLKGIYTHLPFHGAAGERRARAGLTRFEELVGRLRDRGVAPPLVQALSSPGMASGLPLS